ncbi:nucleotidyltransferase family protein [Spirosoma panaciterrae]|uniref:nucleotidyltransferase family protein n=1 Tax=Spirosoma panaciterrae TaxID=496058 RepID=UPI000381997B|nr:nucleotidyltransferase family protein [Spirosoma panaciterrae]
MTTAFQNQQILEYLKPYQPERIGIFGSWARGENGPNSDLDVLIKLSKPVSLLTFVQMEDELSNKLATKVDLVSEGAITNERLKRHIFQDLKIIYEG